MKHHVVKLNLHWLLIVILIALTGTALAQGGGSTSALSGVVADDSGGVVAGASIKVKNNATGATFETVTSDKGTFNVPALNPGTYSVTVTATGFKLASVPEVVLSSAAPSAIRVTLEIGAVTDTVVVTGGVELIQSQSANVATTIDVNQISNLPMQSRNVLFGALTALPGVSTPGGSVRDSTINGLPRSALNITLDGVNIQDNYLKSTDGFFARISPRLDAVEEVTVSSAVPDAQGAGQGSVQVRFITRAGTNQFRGSAYEYLRNPALNSNYWFNNRDLPADPRTGKAPRDQVKINQYGFRLGGPISFPKKYFGPLGFDGRDRLFFFVNYEEFRQPTQLSRQRIVLNPLAAQGVFQYNTAAGVQRVDLLALAAARGQTSTPDPLIAKLQGDIQKAMAGTGGTQQLADPNLLQYSFVSSSSSVNKYPTTRYDWNITKNHHLAVTQNYNKLVVAPDLQNGRDAQFPGFPVVAIQDSSRWQVQGTLRSTLAPTLVNELRMGRTGGITYNATDITPAQYGGTGVGGQGGYNLSFGSACCSSNTLTNPGSGPAVSTRSVWNQTIEDNLTWSRSAHTLTMGGSWTQVNAHISNQTVVPTINFGVDATDPANAMFTTTGLPGASATDLTNARGLYALVTGRVTAINANVRLDEKTNQYNYLGNAFQRSRITELGFFGQDSWRAHPSLTLNFGLRYELQLPFTPLNNSFSTGTLADVFGVSGVGNLFKPGTLTGAKPQFVQFKQGTTVYETDKNNFAPSVGVAWTPSANQGWLGHLFGKSGDTVLRGGFAMSFNRPGMADFADPFGLSNPGLVLTTNRNVTQGNLGTLPLLLRDGSRLGPPAFPTTPTYPFSGQITDSVNVIDPKLQLPYAQSWSFGVQRAIGKDTALEVRYVGTRLRDGLVTNNYNEANIRENGFLDEFRKAQANLQANIAAGRGNTFAYTGAPGTSPLPIFLAYFQGLAAAQAGTATNYTSTSFSNTTFLNFLALNNPQPYNFATSGTNGLYADATRRANALRAGLPANFFVTNPDLLGGANLLTNGAFSRYDALQVDLRRRLSHGLQLGANYVWAKQQTSTRNSLREDFFKLLDAGTPGGIAHSFKVNWVYELPFGKGRRFGHDAGRWLNGLVGGWEFDGLGRVQTGRILNFGNVRLVGMTDKELQQAYRIRKESRVVYILPQDIIDNTIKAFSVSATSANGYGALGAPTGRYFAPANNSSCIQVVTGDCAGTNHYVTGPAFVRFDMSVGKRFVIYERLSFDLRAETLNTFNNINFIPVVPGSFSSATLGQVTAAYRDITNTNDPGGRLVQLVFRLSW